MNDYNELFSLAPLGFPMYSITKRRYLVSLQIKTELIGRIRNGENYKDISILYFK